MASKSKKEKAPKVAIGDQILLDVAKFDLKMNMGASLKEFAEHEIRISALKTYGFIYRVGNSYKLTEQGLAYLKRTFPKGDFERAKAVKHGIQS